MRTTLALIFALILIGLVVIGAAGHTFDRTSNSPPSGAVHNFFELVKSKDFDQAYTMVAPESGIDKWAFIRDVGGNNGSLKTVSELSSAETKVLSGTDSRAKVRTRLQWSTAIGAMNEDRDVEVVKDSGEWRIIWPKPLEPNTTV